MELGRDQTRDPWIAVRLASVARHITDCATQPGTYFVYERSKGFGETASKQVGLNLCCLLM